MVRTRLLLPLLLLALAGCRDLIFPDVPPRVDIVRGAAFAPPEQGAPSESAAGTSAAEETWVGVTVRGPDGGPVGGIPIGWRMSGDEEWKLIGTSAGDPRGIKGFSAPIGAFVTVVGVTSEPAEIQVTQKSPVMSDGEQDLGGAPEAGTLVSLNVFRFRVGATCTFGVRVRNADGTPVRGARFDRIPVRVGYIDVGPLAGETDAEGHAQLVAACTPMHLLIRPIDGPATLLAAIDPLSATGGLQATLPDTFVEVHGTVRDEDGSPVAGYHTRIWHTRSLQEGMTPDAVPPTTRAITDAEGRYSLKVGTSIQSEWTMFRGYTATGGQLDRFTLTPGTPKEWDITAPRGRWVDVRCITTVGTDCRPFGDHSCTGPDPDIKWEHDIDGGRSASPRIWCPVGEAVVHDDAVAVRLAPEENVARLDYRKMTGAVKVRVTRGDEPCRVHLHRPSITAPIGGVSSARFGGDKEARLFEHVPPGVWDITARCGSRSTLTLTEARNPAWSESITVADAMVDLGTIELPAE